jgi:hypothetical protein
MELTYEYPASAIEEWGKRSREQSEKMAALEAENATLRAALHPFAVPTYDQPEFDAHAYCAACGAVWQHGDETQPESHSPDCPMSEARRVLGPVEATKP